MMGPPGPDQNSAQTARDPHDRIGKILQGRYRIVSRIASGGMGSVYRGERLGLGRPVAIKFLHAAMARDPQVMKRFEREAQAMSRLAHPNCIAVLDFGVDELPYLVMDLVHGEPLRATIDVGVVAPRRALKIARQLLSALSHAHAQGIIHRDIKPENVLLEATPGLRDHVRVLDFGLAKMMGSDSGLTVGMAIGTPNYMAPEQMHEGPVDHRADLYAAGIVLYEMLTGKKPFESTELGEVFLKQMGMPMPRLREVAPAAGFSAELEAVILRAAEKDPTRRFPDADAMNEALEAVPEALATPGPVVANELLAPALLAPPPAPKVTAPDATIQESMTAKLAAAVLPTSPPLPAVPRLGGFIAHPLRLAAVAAVASALLVALGAALFLPRRPAPGASQVPAARDTPTAAAPGRTAGATAAETRARAQAGTPASVGPAAARADAPVQRPVSGARAADEPAAQARAMFEARRWSEGMEAYRAAIKLDPARRGDKTLVRPLIASLDSDGKGERAAFLRQLGAPARPLLREAARSHPSPRVRARAAELTRSAASPGPPSAPAKRSRPFLRWL